MSRNTGNNNETQPFPETKWNGFQMRLTKAAREFTKRWKRDRSGFRVDGNAVCPVSIIIFMRGNGELIGWTDPKVSGLEPRSHDWVTELGLDNNCA